MNATSLTPLKPPSRIILYMLSVALSRPHETVPCYLTKMDDHYARPSPNTTYASPVDAMLDTPSYNTSEDRDRTYLAYVGKRQVLKRQFGFMSMLGFSCTLMSTWEGLLASFVQGFSNGGPAGLIYGFICCWIGTLCIVACLAEMASMAPTAGGQYHWVAMLAPRPYQRVFSYITGWLTVTGWQAAFASGVFPAATLIQGIIVLNSTNYVPQRWHGTLLFFALVFLAVFINTYISNHLSKLEGLILVLHVLGFFAVLIPLVYLAPQGTASDVFGTFLNEGGWSTQALAFFVGLNTSVYAFAGADGAAHMAEEIHSASTVVPWTMISAVVVNGALGFGILLSVLFSVGDIQQALDTQTGYPFIEIFARAAGLGGGTVMTCVVMVLGIFGTWALLATASRQMWAFARDNGLPFSRFLARVSLHAWTCVGSSTILRYDLRFDKCRRLSLALRYLCTL